MAINLLWLMVRPNRSNFRYKLHTYDKKPCSKRSEAFCYFRRDAYCNLEATRTARSTTRQL